MSTLEELENEILVVYKQVLAERAEYKSMMRDIEVNLNRYKSENVMFKFIFIVIIYMYLGGILHFKY
jgi:hypothetical protein